MGLPTIAPYPMPTRDDLPVTGPAWRPQPERAALLIHDMQRYFLAAYTEGAEPLVELINNIRSLRTWADELGIPVIYTAQPPHQDSADRMLLTDFWGPGLRDEASAGIADPLAPGSEHTVVTKWRYSAFQRTPVLEMLRERERDQLIVTGVYAHIGCQVTACEAFMLDIQPFFIADAIADFSREQHLQALNWVAGRCGVVTSTEQVLHHTTVPYHREAEAHAG